MLKTAYLDDAVRHLFVADIRFDFNRSNIKSLMYNKIYCQIFEKQKPIDATEKWVFQLSKRLRNGDRNSDPRSYLSTKKYTQ